MPHTTTSRRTIDSRVAPAAVLSLVALVAFVALAFVARPAPISALGHDTPVRIGQVAPSSHPDFVGVAESRPSIGVAHLLALPTSTSSVVAVILAVALAMFVGGTASHSSRWRRWRARLEGVPPLVA